MERRGKGLHHQNHHNKNQGKRWQQDQWYGSILLNFQITMASANATIVAKNLIVGL